MSKTIGIITFEEFIGQKDKGSTYLRAHQLVRYFEEAEISKLGQQYETVIYQKAYFWQHAERFTGRKILDVCDPDWMDWSTPFRRTAMLCDAITTSTERLAQEIAGFMPAGFPIYHVPDRLDLAEFPVEQLKRHEGELKKIAWFGYQTNVRVIEQCLPSLLKRNLELVIISDKGVLLPSGMQKIHLKNYKWDRRDYQRHLLTCDAVLNPTLPTGRWKYKSNNKSLIAWAMGLPVITAEQDFEAFKTAEARSAEALFRRTLVEGEYDIKQSVAQYRQIIKETPIPERQPVVGPYEPSLKIFS